MLIILAKSEIQAIRVIFVTSGKYDLMCETQYFISLTRDVVQPITDTVACVRYTTSLYL